MELTAKVVREDDIAQGEGKEQDGRGGKRNSREALRGQGSGIRKVRGVTWSPQLVEGKYTGDVGVRENAAEGV